MVEETKPVGDILDLIKSRRSITKYLPKPVPWEFVSRLVDAARHAPSCGNIQNWKFIVVLSPEKRKAIAEAALQQFWMMSAPVHIIVCAEPEQAERYYGVRGDRLYTVQNCAAAIENILLEAHSLGLGACWVGAFDEDMLKRSIRAEEFVRPQAIITVGYPAEVPQKPPKNPLNVVTYFEGWRGVVRDPLRYFRDYSLIWEQKIGHGKAALKSLGEKIKKTLRGKPKPSEDHEKQKFVEDSSEDNTAEEHTEEKHT
ncbi:MAG TPA: nitroreductase family protein [Candidatus Nanoarchaeia archaeon]|nr:nitroreductase family protein [Candidatus Nanoarchaeia archaeon]